MADVADLKTCVAAAKGNNKMLSDCETTFKGKGGKTEGGKVFSDGQGGKVFVTDGGKVFDLKP